MRALGRFKKDARGMVGIGTMIVFIAAVIVAAIASAVLIDTSGKLQERSSRTGNEATEQVSGNLQAMSVLGRRDSTGNANLKDLDLFLSVAPGAPAMDLSNLRIQVKTSTKHETFDHVDGAPDADSFNVTEIRDADGTFNSVTNSWVVNGGDLVNVTIALDTAAMEFATRSSITVVLIPEFGNKIEISFLTPVSYGVSTKFILK